MKRFYLIISIAILSFLYAGDTYAQFVVAQDTIRGKIDFCPRLGDFTARIEVPNDSVFYLFPPDKEIDPWRYVGYYQPTREIKRGYVKSTVLMRIDDYEMIDVEKLSANGNIIFREDDVRVNVTVAKIPENGKIHTDAVKTGKYIINGKVAKGVSKNKKPELRYQSVTVSIKGNLITIPKKLYEHLLEPEIDNMAVYYNKSKKTVYIVARNGDEDAYYEALWVVSPKGAANVYIHEFLKK